MSPGLLDDLLKPSGALYVAQPSRKTRDAFLASTEAQDLRMAWRRYFEGALNVGDRLWKEGQVDLVNFGVNLTFAAIPLPPLIAGRPGTMHVQVSGNLIDLLCYQVFSLVATVGLERLQRCKCGRGFIKRGRREYCSTRCQNRYFMQEERARNREAARSLEMLDPPVRRRAKTERRTR